MEFPVSWDNEIKLWTFLETRAALLLKAYKTTSEVTSLKATRGDRSPSRLCSQAILFQPLLWSFVGGLLHARQNPALCPFAHGRPAAAG